MNKIRHAIMFTVAVFWTNFVGAATAIYQVKGGSGSFLQIPLTHDIYRYSHSESLQDLVVLDAEQNSLPYRLIKPVIQIPKIEPHILREAIPFFAVAPDATPDTLRKLHSSQVKIQDGKVQVETSEAILNSKTPEFYLLDVSKVSLDLTSIMVEWLARENNQYLEIEIEATHNLQNWFSLGKATLVQIEQNEQHLKHNHIDLAIKKGEYEFLRIKILRGAENLQLSNIIAEQKIASPITADLDKESWTLDGHLLKNQTSVYLPTKANKSAPVTAWEFTRKESTPVNEIALDQGKQMYADAIKVFTRSAENQHWKLLYQGIWFNTSINDQWQNSDAINIYSNTDKYWRVELGASANNINDLKLVFSWQPIQLQIIASNNLPLLLAIDSANNNTSNREQIFKQITAATSPQWTAAELVSLNIKPEEISNTQKSIDIKQLLFWAALGASVLVLLGFSLRLFRQINAQKQSE